MNIPHPDWIVKHTRGNVAKVVRWSDHSPICEVDEIHAQLIASAPQLLKALKAALAQLENTNMHTPIGDMGHTKGILRDAIELAEG